MQMRTREEVLWLKMGLHVHVQGF